MIAQSKTWNQERREHIKLFEKAYKTIKHSAFIFLLEKYCPKITVEDLQEDEINLKGAELLEKYRKEIIFYDFKKQCDYLLEEMKKAIKNRIEI